MKIYSIKKKKKGKGKNHVGEIGPMYVGKDWSGKLDTRLEPVHRHVEQETDFPVVEKKS